MNKKSCLILLPLLVLVSCNSKPTTLAFKAIAPVGAPSVALANYVRDSNYETFSNTATVRSALINPNEEYKAVIFDATTGLTLISRNNDYHYRLARIITSGNLFVVATGNDDNGTLDATDNILSYGSGNIPDRIFRLTHEGIVPQNYVTSVSETSGPLCLGKYENQDIDYVITSEPILTRMMANTTCTSTITEYENVKETFVEYASAKGIEIDGFPQAGLFIAQSYEADSYQKDVSSMLSALDDNMKDLANNGGKVAGYMDKLSSDDQTLKFGFNSTFLKQLNANGNRLSYHSGYYDLEAFYDLLDLDIPGTVDGVSLLSRYWLTK